MPVAVSDIRSNLNDQLVYAAKVIGRSKNRRAVFKAICFGKKKVKSVSELMGTTKLGRKDVLTAGKTLDNHQIVTQRKKDGETAYEKDSTFASKANQILRLAADPGKRAKVPTKVNPQVKGVRVMSVALPRAAVKVKFITIDDIVSFNRVRKVKAKGPAKMAETKFKRGVQAIVGEAGSFKDWGGEGNDLWTTRLRVRSSRVRCCFAFKGPGAKGKLTPKKMGKNADQIQRLFRSSADVYIVQYWDQIDESIVEQMTAFAQARSAVEGREILYGVIDGDDSARLIAAYQAIFAKA